MLYIRIGLTCFRLIAIPSLFITLLCGVFLWMSGTPMFLVSLFWTKVITCLLLLVFVYVFRSSGFHFFHNLGFSLRAIFLTMIAIDWLVAFFVLGGVALLL